MKNTKFLDYLNNFKICERDKVWFAIPVIFIIVALLVIIILGSTTGSYTNAINIGIDFEGGTVLNVRLGQDAVANYDENRRLITNEIEKYGVKVSYVQQQTANTGSNSSISFRYKNISKNDTEIANLNAEIIAAVDALYPDNPNTDTHFITYESIGATAAQDLLSKAGIAVAVSVALILIYVIFRFTLASGIAAVLALLHDVILMFCLTVICRIQINTSYVAAVITIIAYSINNTIVIFDRCREIMRPFKGQKVINYEQIGNSAVIINLRRSLFTTLTTMITVIFLAIFGSGTIREFCVPIILGLIAGLYSSVFMATPIWCRLSYAFDKIKAQRADKVVVSYDHLKNEDDDEEQTVYKGAAKSDFVIEEDGEVRPIQQKKEKSKAAPVYKYSKKNTTFKKKK